MSLVATHSIQQNTNLEESIIQLLNRLIDQARAKIIVPANAAAPGFWFGGGNLAMDETGTIWLSGRFRNFGDSRTGLHAGERGLELAIYSSHDSNTTFQKVASFTKQDLSTKGQEVISIEGSALHQMPDGQWELFVSSEKAIDYPDEVSAYRKPGTGVWTIDRVTGDSPDQFDLATLETVLENVSIPAYLHIKDPEVFEYEDGSTALVFCSHPYTWASTNTGLAIRPKDTPHFHIETYELVSRGPSWDVASTRITDRLCLPPVGRLASVPSVSIYFYDGAESMRRLDENPHGKHRPRGFSCEELGGAFYTTSEAIDGLRRLSTNEPLLISPYGTGSSRYVSTLVTENGIIATWQQSQADGSQPLVCNFLPMDEVEQLLEEGLA